MDQQNSQKEIREAPLLSICIPTYNRADILDKCLELIVNNKGFSDEVEIIISDNCSKDKTKEISLKYTGGYRNIRYYRNEENIGGERNFLKVLSYARGSYIKLHNDYSAFSEDGLNNLIKKIKSLQNEKPLLFIASVPGFGEERFVDINELLDNVGIKITWIGSYVYSGEEFSNLPDKERRKDSNLMQIDWLIRLIGMGNNCYLCNSPYANNIIEVPRSGHNPFIVFGVNYLDYVNELRISGKITLVTYLKLKKEAYCFIRDFYYLTKKHVHNYDIDNVKKYISVYFSELSYYDIVFFRAIVLKWRSISKELLRPIRFVLRYFVQKRISN